MQFKSFVGIDISKTTIDVAMIRTGDREKVIYEKFLNTRPGYIKMVKWLSSSGCEDLEGNVFFLEHTGVYSVPICLFFEEKDYRYSMESPLEIHKSLGIKRGKSDKSDAVVLAKYAYLHRETLKFQKVPQLSLQKLRVLLALRNRLVKSRTLIAGPVKDLIKFTDKSVHQFVAGHTQKCAVRLDKDIKVVEKKIDELIKSDEILCRPYSLARSVPGIGMVTAAYLLIYTRCFTAFKNSRKFACYSGIAPFEYTSGISIKGRTKVNFIANKHMKSLLGNGAVVAAIYDKELCNYFQKKIAEGKHKMSVYNVIKNKLISRVFATVKRGTPFIGQYEISL